MAIPAPDTTQRRIGWLSTGKLVASNASLNGTLEIIPLNGFVPAAGNAFEILTVFSRTGTFDDITGDYLGQGLFLDPVYNATSLTLVTTQAGLGDTDLDGDVDLSDLGNLASSYGANNPSIDWVNGDFDGNDVVNFDDYALIDLAFNTQGPPLRGRSMAGSGSADRGKSR